MSPTSEADAAERMAWAGEYMVPTEVARRLERERDESRGAWYEMQSSFERSKTEAEQLIRERDEARKEVEYYKARYEQLKDTTK